MNFIKIKDPASNTGPYILLNAEKISSIEKVERNGKWTYHVHLCGDSMNVDQEDAEKIFAAIGIRI